MTIDAVAGTAGTPATAPDQSTRRPLLDEALALYARYGKPLEAEHWGRFLAVSRDGRTVLGDDLATVSREAQETLGRGNFQFKIGEIAVGRI